MKKLGIGTRGSPLALWQANWVKSQIESRHDDVSVDLTIIHTMGDKILDTPLAKVGGKGLFVKEIEVALSNGDVDLAVHSMKDVPTVLPEDLEISIVCDREDPRDAFIAREVAAFSDLPHGAKVGTSSLRRQAQILHRRPDIEIVSLRGNIGTRVRKLTEQNLDAIMLAAAGLLRMEEDSVITEYMPADDFIPAVAQGALGIETRIGDKDTLALIDFLNHEPTSITVGAERAFLARLEGGCQAPIAAHATLNDGNLALEGLVGLADGSLLYRETHSGKAEEFKSIGITLAETLLDKGADDILKEVYENHS